MLIDHLEKEVTQGKSTLTILDNLNESTVNMVRIFNEKVYDSCGIHREKTYRRAPGTTLATTSYRIKVGSSRSPGSRNKLKFKS